MDKIKVAILNPTAISEAEKMMVCAARLTQRGHTVKDLSDFLALYDKEYTEKTAKVTLNALLEMRYLKYLKWEEIAVRLDITFRWTMTLHKKALTIFTESALIHAEHAI